MTTQVLHLRSAVSQLRPRPTDLLDGQLMLNTNADEPGVYFRLSDNSLARLSGVHIGTNPPNYNPSGYTQNSEGEIWVDTTDIDIPLFKVFRNGSWFTVSTEGLKGDKGQKGEQGNQGIKCDKGEVGQKGQKGEIGFKGDKGEVGASGGTGGTGDKGQKGEIGPTGQKGQKGEVAPHPDTITVNVYNGETGTIAKGKAVYVSGTHASGVPLVKLADNDGTNTYPSLGLVEEDIPFGDPGEVVISGELAGLDTDTNGWDPGTALYMDSTAGDLTATRPTASTEKVQKVALVSRRDPTNGSVVVIGAGRTNDVPNELTALTGVGLNDTDLGTFTGTTITDDSSIKTALQELETQVETNIGAAALRSALNILSFADDTAAGGGGLSNGDIYWNTTDNKLRAV
jgi:hypothetical protein